MPVFYDGAFIRVMSQKLFIFAKNLNHICLNGFYIHLCSCIYFMHCNQKNMRRWSMPIPMCPKIFQGIHLSETYPWFWFLTTLSQKKKINFKIHSLTKSLFRLKIFAIYLPLKLIFFIVHIFSIRTSFIKQKFFLLSWKELMLIISIINAPLNFNWLASFSSYKLLIGLLQFNWKLVQAASY